MVASSRSRRRTGARLGFGIAPGKPRFEFGDAKRHRSKFFTRAEQHALPARRTLPGSQGPAGPRHPWIKARTFLSTSRAGLEASASLMRAPIWSYQLGVRSHGGFDCKRKAKSIKPSKYGARVISGDHVPAAPMLGEAPEILHKKWVLYAGCNAPSAYGVMRGKPLKLNTYLIWHALC